MTEPLPGPDELIDKAARVLHAEDPQAMHERFEDEGPRYLETARKLHSLLADPGLQADRRELADQLASANEHVEEQDARISQLEAEVVKQKSIAQYEANHWRRSAYVSALQRDYERARAELRKLNDAMTRKNRVIAKRAAERDLALWLHAEAKWWLDQYMHDVTLWKRQVDELGDERTRLQEQVAAGHRVQLAVAGQWLHHAAVEVGDETGADYLTRLGEWLTDGTDGDEPKLRAALQGDQPEVPGG